MIVKITYLKHWMLLLSMNWKRNVRNCRLKPRIYRTNVTVNQKTLARPRRPVKIFNRCWMKSPTWVLNWMTPKPDWTRCRMNSMPF